MDGVPVTVKREKLVKVIPWLLIHMIMVNHHRKQTKRKTLLKMTANTRKLLELLSRHGKPANQIENFINLGAGGATRERTLELDKSRICLLLRARISRKQSQNSS
ncbi:hypothetical protein EYF80_022417 [Liparis tanakae]|uniref:Uncharacterized protein n=1 Tax=Liparis tanakae TaxID=230148 RepID=A0A4Z2HP02_9TELE|nr:hypothetical protein EYF80_022417 [Liparis tanakae]